MINSRWLLLSVSVVAILVFSTIFVGLSILAIPAQAQQAKPGANWEWLWYDGHGTNFNPQTEITKENVHLLELKWMYPFPLGAFEGPRGFGVVGAGAGGAGQPIAQGFAVPPLVVNGIV